RDLCGGMPAGPELALPGSPVPARALRGAEERKLPSRRPRSGGPRGEMPAGPELALSGSPVPARALRGAEERKLPSRRAVKRDLCGGMPAGPELALPGSLECPDTMEDERLLRMASDSIQPVAADMPDVAPVGADRREGALCADAVGESLVAC